MTIAIPFPAYSHPELADAVLHRIASEPPLLSCAEVGRFARALDDVAAGRAFLLQAGDCAERFSDCEPASILRRAELVLTLAAELRRGLAMPVVSVGRIAGQYAKPRSSFWEIRDSVRLPSYQGDMINGLEFSPAARMPDPERLMAGFRHAARTLACLRGHTAWEDGDAPFFTSREALVLPYEAAVTRTDAGLTYNSSTHFPWIGMRTALPEAPHVRAMAGLVNPVGVKVGPHMTPASVQRLVEVLNPERQPGHLALITRLGVAAVDAVLPQLVAAVNASGIPVLWMVDPMHGNTRLARGGTKFRLVDEIVGEIRRTAAVHRVCGTRLAGVHLEVSPDDILECVANEVSPGGRFASACDPRLNRDQSLAVVRALGETLSISQ